MKVRQIHTKIWIDSWFDGLTISAKLLFIFLLTNPHINLVGIYELPDKVICSETGLTPSQLKEAKKSLADKVLFYKDYIKIANCEKYDNFSGGKLVSAKQEQLKELPREIIAYFENTPSIGYRYPIDTPNSNSNSNSNSNVSLESGENLSLKKDYSQIKNLDQDDFQNISDKLKVPIAFVLSKFEDMENWHLMKPQKNKYANYSRALYDWCKRDAIKMMQQERRAIGNPRSVNVSEAEVYLKGEKSNVDVN